MSGSSGWRQRTPIILAALCAALVILACGLLLTGCGVSVSDQAAVLPAEEILAPTTTVSAEPPPALPSSASTTVAPTTTSTIASTISTAISGQSPTSLPAGAVAATLVRVTDGDTIVVNIGGREEKVRYIGIDTPETVHPQKPVEYMGKEASAHNTKLVASGPLRLELDVEERDRYGRLLAYVWAGEVFINRQMVLDGFAQVSTYPPNVKYEDVFLAAQRQARERGIGLWAETVPEATSTTLTRTAGGDSGGDGDTIVHITKTGKKYHRAGCQHLSKSDIEVTLAQAKADGLGPCKVCKPPQ